MSTQKGVSKYLFPELADFPKIKNVPRRTRFRRCKSAPSTEFIVPIEKLVSTSSSSNDSRSSSNNPFSFKSILINKRPSFGKMIIFLSVYLGLGTTCFYLFRNQLKGKKTNGVLDAIYFCIVTMTTVGYGDIVPNSKASKLLACAFVFTGMALVGLTLSKAANYLVEKQELLVVKALNRSKNTNQLQVIEEAKNNRTKYKCVMISIVLLVLMTIGVIFLTTVEGLDFVDAFYCVCCTVTTLGYGDVSFSTQGGRVFAIFWIMISTICLAQFFLYIAEFNTELRQRKLVDLVLNRPMTYIDLEAADLDDDGSVEAAEFIIYKLKEMGKVSSEDLSLIMVEFNSLDIDQSGSLSLSDITLAQLSPPHSKTPKYNNAPHH